MGVIDVEIGGTARPGLEPASRGVRIGSDRLTDRLCKTAKPRPSAFKLFDGKGLFLLVQRSGAKLWRMKYRHGGNERLYAIGAYPDVGLAAARAERDRARGWLREGRDPVQTRQLEKTVVRAKQANTFAAVADEFAQTQEWSPAHRAAVERRLKRELLPAFGALPIDAITAPLVLATLKKIEARDALETASKCRILASQIFRHAIITGRMTVDPAAHLSKVMTTRKPVNRATVALAEMPTLFGALAKVPAEPHTKLAFYWLLLTATRTAETRFAVWAEIDSGEKVWRVPPERMKMRNEHVVPLSTQALKILDRATELRTSDDDGGLIFPGFTRAGHLSENALLALLARAGFYGRQTAHGLRASFSTWAHERAEADPDVVEACLAHARGDVRAIYNRATYLSQRRRLLQQWADQCEAWGMRLP